MKNTIIVDAAKKRFDNELHSNEYKKIHSDDSQLIKLLECMDIIEEKKYLDIGTGNGYVALALAKKFSKIFVHGLDIAENSININNENCIKESIENASFESYSGMDFPYADGQFYGAVSRFAFHHFPDYKKSISEISRVLEQNGFFLFSDPETYIEDEICFVDQFQQIMKDGHVHFYKKDEIVKYFIDQNMELIHSFKTYITYPRIINNDYLNLFEQTPRELIDLYKINIVDDKVYITVRVMNLLFKKEN